MRPRIMKCLLAVTMLLFGALSPMAQSHLGIATVLGQSEDKGDGPFRSFVPVVLDGGDSTEDIDASPETLKQQPTSLPPEGVLSDALRELPDDAHRSAFHAEDFVEIEIVDAVGGVQSTLAAMDLYCETLDPCVLTVGEGMLSRLAGAGIDYREQARGIKYSLGVTAAEAVQYRAGINTTNFSIPDFDGSSGFEFSPVTISDAPTGQTVTRVRYTARIGHTYPSDLLIQLNNDQGFGAELWGHLGGSTDGGFDDDLADDDDIYLSNRWIDDAFDGDDVNQNWFLDVWDDVPGDVGYIDYFLIWIYYETSPDIDVQPGTTTFEDSVVVDSLPAGTLQESANPTAPEPAVGSVTSTFPAAPAERPIAVPGELVVGYEPGIGAAALGAAAVSSDLAIAQTVEPIGVALVTVPPGEEEAYIRKLEANPAVRYAEPNYYYYATLVPNDTQYGSMWGLPKINAPAAWDVTTGSPDVVIAVVDTGVDYDHEDLDGKVVGGYDFVNDDADPMDDHGHGTHVAGTAAAATNNNLGVAGVSWLSTIMPVKVLNASGSGSLADIILGFIYAADNGAEVINMSLGGEFPSQAFQDAVNYAYGEGLVIVAAAGNCGDPSNYTCWSHNAIGFPAAYDHVISVAATAQDDSRAPFSNYNYAVDVAAPGVGILSTIPGDTYTSFNGTSMASPHVAGLAALILAANPDASNLDVESILKYTATDLGVPGRDDEFGFGLINAEAAVLASDMKSLVIDNRGTQSLEITSIEKVNGSCWLTVDVAVALPYELAGLQSLIVPLSADSSCVSGGLHSEIVRVSSNDVDEPVVDVDVFLDVDSIYTPISGLSASNDGPTELGGATHFMASVSAGSSPQFTWDFGDGSSGTGASPSHTYAAAGSYTAEVTVSNPAGSDSTTTVVDVVDVPISGLNAGNDGPTELGDPTTFNASVLSGTSVSYSWDFGDGSSGSGASPSHTYGTAGVHTATVTASNSVNKIGKSTTVLVVNVTTEINGTVYVDTNGNGKHDAGEPGLAGVTLALSAAGASGAAETKAADVDQQTADPIATTSTNDEGVFVMADIRAGEYVIALTFAAGSGFSDADVPLVIEADADGQVAPQTEFNIAASPQGAHVFLPSMSR